MKKNKDISIATKASIAYTVGNLTSRCVSFVTMPIFTRLMSTSEIGVTTTYSSWYTIFYSIVTLSLTSGSLSVAMMDFSDKRDQYESACLTLSSISGCIFFLAYLLLKNWIDKWTTLDTSLMLLIAIGMIINPALDYWYVRQRYEYKYKISVTVSILNTIVSSMVALICVLCAKSNVNLNLGNVKAIATGSVTIFFSLVAYFYIMLNGKCYINLNMWKYGITLSAPLILHTIAKNVLDVSDRLMISVMCGKSETGIYGTIYSLAMVSTIVWSAINTSIIPIMFERLKEGKEKTLLNLLVSVLLFVGVITIIFTLMAPELIMIIATEEYYSAVYLIPALSAGVYFTALYNIYGNFLLYKKKTMYIMIATFLAAAVNIYLNYISIKVYGYIAAAYTTMICFILLAFLQGLMVYIVYKRNVVDNCRFFVLSSIIAVICLMCNFLYTNTFLRYAVIICLLIICFYKRKDIKRILD